MIKSAARILPAIAVMLLASAAQNRADAQTPVPVQRTAQSTASPGTKHWEEAGEATWYGGRHHGRRTSSGAIFDQNAMTAAHSSLPLGSRVRVTVQETGESVVVTINDRQPPKIIRIIDLSRGAASRIGILSRGTAMVTLTPAQATDPVEVAEAATDTTSTAVASGDAPAISGAAPQRRGQPHTRPAAR